MGAGMDTSELYRVAVSYKAKLGPFATPRILNEYLKAVFRAPDLSSSFVEAMDLVVNQLLKVKDQELVDAIAEIARDMAKGQEYVGMSILLFTFERILPPALSETQLEPLRRALGKALPGNVEDNMFELAKDAYSLGTCLFSPFFFSFPPFLPPSVVHWRNALLPPRQRGRQHV